MIIKWKEKSCAAGDSDNIQTERTPRKRFRCGSEDNLIEKCPKPPKYNEKRQNQVHFSERGDHVSQKNVTTAKIMTTKSYMYLWHVCLIIVKLLVGILVIVCNWPIGF